MFQMCLISKIPPCDWKVTLKITKSQSNHCLTLTLEYTNCMYTFHSGNPSRHLCETLRLVLPALQGLATAVCRYAQLELQLYGDFVGSVLLLQLG